MDTNTTRRQSTLAKTLSFAAVHFIVAFAVGYLLTGSVLVGSVLALVEPAVNTVAYYFHEQVWRRIESRRGRRRLSGRCVPGLASR